MLAALWISVVLNVLLFGALGYGVFLLNRAGQQINDYDAFYQQTIEALEKNLSVMQKQMNSMGLSNDESYRNIFKTIRNFYEMLVNYYNARKDDSAAPLKAKRNQSALKQ